MNITKALKELCPNCGFSVIDEDYNKIIWNNNNPLPLPTKEVVEAKALEITNREKQAKAQKEADALAGNNKLLELGLTQAQVTAMTGYTPPTEV